LATGFFVVDFFSADALGAALADLEDGAVGFVERGRDAMDSSLG
jgi:hypothetical protein